MLCSDGATTDCINFPEKLSPWSKAHGGAVAGAQRLATRMDTPWGQTNNLQLLHGTCHSCKLLADVNDGGYIVQGRLQHGDNPGSKQGSRDKAPATSLVAAAGCVSLCQAA